jgi:hypothetical protein
MLADQVREQGMVFDSAENELLEKLAATATVALETPVENLTMDWVIGLTNWLLEVIYRVSFKFTLFPGLTNLLNRVI